MVVSRLINYWRIEIICYNWCQMWHEKKNRLKVNEEWLNLNNSEQEKQAR